MAQVQLQDDDRTFDPIITSPGTAGGRVAGGGVDAAKSLYGGKWDADAQQQYDYRKSLGQSDDEILKHTAEDFAARFPASQGQPRGVGPLFDDASTNQLENIARAQMGEVRSNPGLNDLMAFLDKEFKRLSTSPGFTPEEAALLHTQALEPIEQRRQASNTRAVERAGARGFLPTSGLTYLTDAPSGGTETLDTTYDRMRTTADRDLALAGVNQRRADLNQAVQLGSLRGLDIPKSQRSEELMLSQLLYQLPRNSLQDLMMVLGGSSSPTDLYNQTLGLTNQNMQLQQQNDARNAALMQQIGAILGTLFR